MKAVYALAMGASLVAAVPSLEVKGNSFVNPKTGKRFELLGVDYQPGGSAGFKPDDGIDPLTDSDICMRDAALMQSLGVNTIRVYNLSPNLNHDKCASIFNAAGIYMAIDVNSPLTGQSLTSYEPWASYYAAYLNHTFAVVEAFKSYPNTLLFFSGNEVINDNKTVAVTPGYLRAVTRDLKNYIKLHSNRTIPVGYSAADVRSVLFDTWSYLTCSIEGEDDNISRGDLFALNSYSWCGASTFKKSGYDTLVSGFKDTSVPVFFSEFGCNDVTRLFTEVGAIYGSEMNTLFSGGLVYEWTQEANNYGLVKVNSNGSVSLLGDFNRLYNQYHKLNWTDLENMSPPTTPSITTCKPSIITTEGFESNWTLPAIPTSDGSDKILKNGVSPKPVGKIVDVSSIVPKHAYYDVDGNLMTNIKFKTVADDAFNYPGFNGVTIDASNTSANTTSDSSSDSSKSTSSSSDSSSDSSSTTKSSSKSASSSSSNSTSAAVTFKPAMLGMALPVALALWA